MCVLTVLTGRNDSLFSNINTNERWILLCTFETDKTIVLVRPLHGDVLRADVRAVIRKSEFPTRYNAAVLCSIEHNFDAMRAVRGARICEVRGQNESVVRR